MKSYLAIVVIAIAPNLCVAGEDVWVSIKTIDSTVAQGYANYTGAVDSSDLNAVEIGSAAPEFIRIKKIVVFESGGAVKSSKEYLLNGKNWFGGEKLIRTSQIVDVDFMDKSVIKDLEKISSK